MTAITKERAVAALPGYTTALKNRHPNASSPAQSDARLYEKAEATLIAAYALRGFTVHKATDGFLVSRWGLTRHCPDFESLTAFAKQVGASC